jgi:hypothetical protein
VILSKFILRDFQKKNLKNRTFNQHPNKFDIIIDCINTNSALGQIEPFCQINAFSFFK